MVTAPPAPAGVQPPITFVIVDYGLGNLRSVANALIFLGCDAVVSDRPEDVRAAGALVLPGVGAFGEAKRNLRRRGSTREHPSFRGIRQENDVVS